MQEGHSAEHESLFSWQHPYQCLAHIKPYAPFQSHGEWHLIYLFRISIAPNGLLKVLPMQRKQQKEHQIKADMRAYKHIDYVCEVSHDRKQRSLSVPCVKYPTTLRCWFVDLMLNVWVRRAHKNNKIYWHRKHGDLYWTRWPSAL